MTSCFVCATLKLGRKKSTGTEPRYSYIFVVLWDKLIDAQTTNHYRQLAKLTTYSLENFTVMTQILLVFLLCNGMMNISHFYNTVICQCVQIIQQCTTVCRQDLVRTYLNVSLITTQPFDALPLLDYSKVKTLSCTCSVTYFLLALTTDYLR